MNALLKFLLLALALILIFILGMVAYVSLKGIPSYEIDVVNFPIQSTPEKVERGALLSSMVCNQCHKSHTDQSLKGRFVEDLDPVFGKIFSANITQHNENGIGKYTPSELAYLMRTGIKRNGNFAPPYMPKYPLMSDEDLEAIICFLKSDHPLVKANSEVREKSKPSFFTKALTNFVIKPFPYPKSTIPHPKLSSKIEYGEYLATAVIGCSACHSADFKTYSDMEPSKSPGFFGGGNSLFDMEGNLVLSPNITMHESGIGGWSEQEFIKAVRFGQRPEGNPTKYPMLAYSALSEEEVSAIFSYLQTIPKIKNVVASN